MVQPKKEHGVESAAEEGSALNAKAQINKYDELLGSLLNDKKNMAIKKHPELIPAYKALEVYEHYFLAGGDWDEIGAVEFKKKMAKKIISDLVKKHDLS